MSRRNGAILDLKLNLSPPRASHPRVESPSRSLNVSPTSSCVSSELNQQDEYLHYSTSPEATSMMLVGCPRCLMYVMLAEEDPKCPKCKSSVLLDIIHDSYNTNTTTTRKSKKSWKWASCTELFKEIFKILLLLASSKKKKKKERKSILEPVSK